MKERGRRPGSGARGAALVGVLGALAAAAPWISPADPNAQEDVAGARLLPPLTRAHAVEIGPERVLVVRSLRRTPEGWEYERAGRRETLGLSALAAPPAARFYLLGTDALGRDLTSRLLHGLRHTAAVSASAAALAMLLGVGVGAAAGLAGGWRDAALMRGVDALMSIPRLLLYLLLAALFRPSAAALVVVLGATTWTGLARLVRAQVASLRGSDMILAARSSGCPTARTLLVHVLPQLGPLAAVSAALRLADTIVLESAVAFLGLGAPPPAVSLGGIIAGGRDALAEAWWIAAWPGLLIVVLVLAVRAAAARLFRLDEPVSIA